MNGTELRIGNYISVQGTRRKVVSIARSQVTFQLIGATEGLVEQNFPRTTYEDCMPILLDENHLDEMGFFKEDDVWHHPSSGAYFYQSEEVGYHYTDGNSYVVDLSHLHALQNFVYTMTGQEIDFN